MPEEPTPQPQEISVPDDLTALDDDALRALHGQIQERYQNLRAEAKTGEQVDALRQLRQSQATIAEALQTRITEAAEVTRSLAELDEAPGLPEATPATPEGEVTPEATPEAPVTSEQTPTPVAVSAAVSAAELAAARTPQTPAQQRPSVPATPNRPVVAYRAAAGQREIGIGQEVGLEEIGRMGNVVKSQIGSSKETVRAVLASLPGYEHMAGLDTELLGNHNSTQRNDELIREATEVWQARRDERFGREPRARTAAICTPFDIIREIPNYSSDADPLGDVFPSRPAGRLGFQFTPAITLEEVEDAVQAAWTNTEQALVDPDDSTTWKDCIDIGCASPLSVAATGVSGCFTFDLQTDISSPERVRDIMTKLAAQRVRARTRLLLGIIDTASIGYDQTATVYGSWADVVFVVEQLLARLTYAERLDVADYEILLPPGLAESFVADIQGKFDLAESEVSQGAAELVSRLQNVTGAGATILRDERSDIAGIVPFAALPAAGTTGEDLLYQPADSRIRIVSPGSAIYFSTGELNVGVESDPQLLRQNKRQYFSEEFVGLAKHGSPPWAFVDIDTCANGTRAASATARACAA